MKEDKNFKMPLILDKIVLIGIRRVITRYRPRFASKYSRLETENNFFLPFYDLFI